MDRSLRVRKFAPEDSQSILDLAQKYTSWDITVTQTDIAGFHSNDPESFLVAEDAGQIIGFIFGRLNQLPDEVLRRRKATRAGSIEILAVSEKHRRRGVATLLLNTLLQIFKETGIDYVSLSVPSEENAARKLYDKMGFQVRAYFMNRRL